ncbi:MAG: hypothetical protein OZ913_00480 [Ignavibacteriaceae bacterium]|nr:MAG: 5'-3'-deoxyribonucleotidase [Chlorobiota bacterium]MBV6397711.1 hypothetical protein [Ignavibacteria bacterium]MCC6885491.1 hypothetical protein [Ignavibacteriales bacterium]MCE7952843.1 5'-3'-deoxyribonucleotidase [Chlorobi bacterium CHB7]MDL1886990.1 5'-3'-deoxyribonucleotidase [Ignavibacteria bacterium CHB1]MEB2328762.1 hypothetical protein [Ignavibacteriaceae bacterium]RIK49602.1 MAG: 5'-3'-deoxyribonucleotidase [Ignavibacteriota bacterium]
MILLIDMDDVITDFEGEFIEKWKLCYPDKPYVKSGDRRGFSIIRQYPEEFHGFVKRIYHDRNFCRNLPPVDGSIEALREIQTMPGIDAFICSSPLFPNFTNSTLDKFIWVKNHLGESWVNRLILTYDKTVITGDFLIDDNPDIIGSSTPNWEHIVYDQPYNRNSKTVKRLTWKNWKKVLSV